MPGRRAAWVDAGLYASSAAFAVMAKYFWWNPLQRQWASTAVWAYAGGALLALAVALLRPHAAAERLGTAFRVAILLGVFGGAVALPLVANVWARAGSDPGTHAQSETIIIEEAARQLVAGHNPYVATYLHGPLRSWPLGTKSHFPYLPGAMLFGLPRALGGDGAATDARVWLTGVSLLAGLSALRIARASGSAAVRALQLLVVLPTGALAMAGGGEDVSVLALMLLALALVRSRRPAMAGLAMGLAASIKQTAWPLLPFLVLAARRRDGRPAREAALGRAMAVIFPIVLPFVLWNPSAFVEDAVRFPLGLGRQPTLAAGPTLGRLLREAFPGLGAVLAMAAMIVVGAAIAYLAVKKPARNAAEAAIHAAVVLSLAVVLSTAGRFGYLAYPVGLAGWAVVVLAEKRARWPFELAVRTDARPAWAKG